MVHLHTSLNRGVSALALGIVLALAAPTFAHDGHEHAMPAAATATVATPAVQAVDIVRDPTDLPPPIGERAPAERARRSGDASRSRAQLANGTTYTYWTFNGKVPGPFSACAWATRSKCI